MSLRGALLSLLVSLQVFWPGEPRPVFFVASRGHHADIGGITPGSMPPHSHSLQEEGAVFISFKLVKDGVFQEEGGCSPSWGWGRGCMLALQTPRENLSSKAEIQPLPLPSLQPAPGP